MIQRRTSYHNFVPQGGLSTENIYKPSIDINDIMLIYFHHAQKPWTLRKQKPYRYVPGSKLPLFPYNRG